MADLFLFFIAFYTDTVSLVYKASKFEASIMHTQENMMEIATAA